MALILIAALAQSPGPSYTEYKDRYCSSIDCNDGPCSGGYHFGNEPVSPLLLRLSQVLIHQHCGAAVPVAPLPQQDLP